MRLAYLVLALLLLGLPPAFADHEVSAGSTYYFAGVTEHQSGHGAGSQQTSSGPVDQVVDTVETVACSEMHGDQTCAEPIRCDNGDIMSITTVIYASGYVADAGSNCPEEAQEPPVAVVTPGMVAAAFQRIPLPESELNIQPPNGRTLVNFDTNFFTEGGEFTRTIRLLGREVELRIWPERFGWRFGDGESTWTTEPGGAYPHLEITHRYLQKGRVTPSVDTTYAAEFRVDGGPWRPVNGTVTIPGTPEGLRVVTARPVLVGG